MPSYTIQFETEETKETVSSDGKRVITHTRGGVVAEVEAVSTHTVKANCGHNLGEAHYVDQGSTLRDIVVTRKPGTRGNFAAYDVKLVYSSDAAESADDVDPYSQRVKRSQGSAEQTLYIIKDRNGTVITNAAGQHGSSQ